MIASRGARSRIGAWARRCERRADSRTRRRWYADSMSMRSHDLKFDLGEEVASQWSPAQPEFSHCASALMAALPQLEPYFMHNVREALEYLRDPVLVREAECFIQQEGRHAQQHRAWNQVLARRYPGFDALERAIKMRLGKSKRRHSLPFRLAYTAGYEALTYQVVSFFVSERERFLRGADPRLLALLAWHAVEEVEHKSVAFDVFEAVHGGYAMRIAGLLMALAYTARDLNLVLSHLLRADGLAHDRESRRRLRAVRIALARQLLPELRQYMKLTYHPSQHRDPKLADAWLAHFGAGRDLRALTFEALDVLARGASIAQA
jgi:predicted metal-dependent hydrolase